MKKLSILLAVFLLLGIFVISSTYAQAATAFERDRAVTVMGIAGAPGSGASGTGIPHILTPRPCVDLGSVTAMATPRGQCSLDDSPGGPGMNY